MSMDKRLSLLLINTDSKTHAAMKSFQKTNLNSGNNKCKEKSFLESQSFYENKQMKYPFGLRENRFDNFIYNLKPKNIELKGSLVKRHKRNDSIDSFTSFNDLKLNRSLNENFVKPNIRLSSQRVFDNNKTSRVIYPSTIDVNF